MSLDEAKGDKKGPVSIAAAVTAPCRRTRPSRAPRPTRRRPETRVVVIGDSDFAANATLGIQGNSDLFMNTIGWLSQQENLISIRPKEADDRRITLTATQQIEHHVAVAPHHPGAASSAPGVYTWWRRR